MPPFPLDAPSRARPLLVAVAAGVALAGAAFAERARGPGGAGVLTIPLGVDVADGPPRGCKDHHDRAKAGPFGSLPAAAAALRAARCLAGADDVELVRAWGDVLRGPLHDELLVAAEAAAALSAAKSGDVAARIIGPATLARSAPAHDTVRREAMGTLLALLVTDGAEAHRGPALTRLMTELAETAASSKLLQSDAGTSWRAPKDRGQALARARTLAARHANREVLALLKPHAPSRADVSEVACEVRYLLGKTSRKLRRYRSARAQLDFVAAKCPEPWRKKARYLAARVASFQGKKGAMAVIDRFLADYPDDTLTDDVLVWKAERFVAAGDAKAAEGVYVRIAEEHAAGDMVQHARFTAAYLRAERGDSQGAIALLDEQARRSIDAPGWVHDQALYWSARLKVFPELASLETSGDEAARTEGILALAHLAATRPASFYGHLARKMALHGVELSGAGRAAVDAVLAEGDAGLKRSSSRLPVRVGALSEDPRFSGALALHEERYDAEAALLLDGLLASDTTLTREQRLAVAAVYDAVGAGSRAHQVLRNGGLALPPGRPAGADRVLWDLAYPRAHASAIEAAAKQAALPAEVLFGLAREESAFDASVVSWAGAIGLCQLMDFTAKEEAGLAKLGYEPTLEQLRAPALNAQLGANHLARRWKSLKHPLLAIAAYNAGPGNVRKWTRKGPLPIDAFVESIPVEQTRNYVKKVTGSWVTYTVLAGGAPVSFDVVRP